MYIRISITGLALILAAPAVALGQNPFLGPDEAGGVQNTNGSPSPSAAASNIDDYSGQDEQINLTPTSGIVKVLRVNQKNLIQDFVTSFYPIANAFPREMRNVFRTVTGKEGGRAELIRDKVGGKAYLQVICPEFQLPWIEEAVKALDVEWLEQGRDGSLTGAYYPKYRPADTFDSIASEYAGQGATQVDLNRSLILRRDEPYRTAKYLGACELLDIPPPCALLKFTVYEVDTSNDLKLGVDWQAWKNGPGRSLFELLFAGQDSVQHFKNASGFFDPNLGASTVLNNGHHTLKFKSTQYLLSANYLLTSAYLDFLRVMGKARVLAEPEIYVQTHEIGIWSSVSQFLAFDAQPSNPPATGIVPTKLNSITSSVNTDMASDFNDFIGGPDDDPDFSAHDRTLTHNKSDEALGLFLTVSAAIGTESSELTLEFLSTDLSGTTPQGTPMITTREIKTKIRLVDGQPFVFGGLTREEKVEASNKAPWFGDIPVLGYLFGQETTTNRRKEIVITCVPHFFQGAPKDITDPLVLDTIAMASGNKEIPVPQNSFGFDQWMFSEAKKP